jgi:hypothetical protein
VWQIFRRNVGAQFTPIRGAWMAIAMLLPVAIIQVLGHSRVSSAAAGGALLGVLFVAFCDPGSSHSLPIRARAMAAGTLVGALLLGLGSWIGGPTWWVAALTLGLVTFLGGVLALYGPVAAQLGVILSILFAVALGRGGGPASAAPSLLGFLVGGTVVTLFVMGGTVVIRFVLTLSAFRRPSQPIGGAAPAARAPATSPSAPVTPQPRLIRFAALRAAGTALVAGVAWGIGLPYPEWAALVVIGSTRPNQMTKLGLTMQLAVGTCLGAALAGVVLSVVHDPVVVVVLTVGVVFVAFTVKDVNETFYMFFFTILILLLLSLPSPGHAPVGLRVATTLVGAAVALGLSWLSGWFVRRAAAPPRQPPEPSQGAAAA